MADLANIAAATAAGYSETVLDRGSNFVPATGRFEVTLEKHLVGEAGASSSRLRGFGQGASQVAAETQALAALNGQRTHRYGSGGGNEGAYGATLTTDQH